MVPYALLFILGTTWTYDVAQGIAPEGGVDPLAKAQTTRVTCTVASVRTVGAATVSTITCAGAPAGNTVIAGDWVMTKRGLWLSDVSPATPERIRKLTRRAPLMRARPRVVAPRDLGDEGTGSTTSVTHAGGVWCAHDDYRDPGGGVSSSLCFEGGAILSATSDTYYWSEGGGGSANHVTRVP